MKIDVTAKELPLLLASLDGKHNAYAHSDTEVLAELNAVNELYNRLSEIQVQEQSEELTPEQVGKDREEQGKLIDRSVRIIGRNGPMWFESMEQALNYFRSLRENQERPEERERMERTRGEDLERRIMSVNEALSVHAAERSTELRNDPTIDPDRIGDVIRLEMAELRLERDRLYEQVQSLDAELGLQQELGIER